ncbi:hypothetical protein [Phocaeicola coprophilus]|uniref:hypothetical protein n=1 Tax=Phocaeicola coprophilus TaxID=387090 RepID=UPI0030785890
MDDSKVFMFPDGGTKQTNDVNSLLPLLMMSNGGMNGGGWMWIIFLFFLYPLMRNGGLFGNAGGYGNGCLGPLANMVNNNDGRDLIMQAINGNGAAVQRLATMFGAKVDMIQAAISQVNNAITQIGCKIDSSTGALLNAGTQNTMTLAQQLANCCCNLKTMISDTTHQSQLETLRQTDTIKESVNGVGNAVTRGFADVGYALRDQTCNLEKSIDSVGNRVIAKLDATEKAAMQDKINSLQTQLTTEHQSGVIAQQIAAAVNPIAAAVQEIKCAQPQTVTVPYQPFQAIPNCVAYQYGMYNNNNLNGFWL